MIAHRILASLCVFIVISCTRAIALDRWEYYTYENIYYCLASEGNYLWAGTSGGVVRWDVNTKEYRKFEPPIDLTNDWIRAVAVDSRGNKWFGTDENGAIKFDGERWTLYSTQNGMSHNKVYSIACDGNGNTWIGTENGINKIDGSGNISWVKVSGADNLPVYVIFFDRKGTMWCGSAKKAHSYDGTRWKEFRIEGSSDDDNRVLGIAEDKTGNIWAVNSDCGPAKYNGFSWRFVDTEGTTAINSLYIDNNNHIWFSSGTGFLSEFDGIHWNLYIIGDYYSDSVLGFAGDQSGNLWLATYEGLKRFDNGNEKVFKTIEGLIGHGAHDMVIDKNNNKWFGSREGLTRFDGSHWSHYSAEYGDPFTSIDAIGMDHEGSIWIGADEKVFSLDGSDWKNVGGTSRVWAMDIGFDNYGIAWFGSAGGALRYNGNIWTHYDFAGSMSNNDVNSLVVDCENRVWFCALDGLRMFDGLKWFKYSMSDGLPDSAFTASAMDHQGNIWFGTKNNGIAKFDGMNWVQYDEDNGLMNNYVSDIAIDREGNVWVSTGGWIDWGNQHVSKFDGVNWIDYPELRGESVDCIGIDSLGNKWFGTGSGVYMLSTEDIPSGIAGDSKPEEFYLGPNYPNPFNHLTVIRYSLPVDSQLKIEIFNLLGQKIRTLIDGVRPAGDYTAVWDGLNDSGRIAASGIYLYRIETPHYRQSRKMTFIK